MHIWIISWTYELNIWFELLRITIHKNAYYKMKQHIRLFCSFNHELLCYIHIFQIYNTKTLVLTHAWHTNKEHTLFSSQLSVLNRNTLPWCTKTKLFKNLMRLCLLLHCSKKKRNHCTWISISTSTRLVKENIWLWIQAHENMIEKNHGLFSCD